MNHLNNDEKIKNIQRRKILKGLIVFFAILTIVASLLSLWKNVTPLFAIIFFLIEVVLSKYRESLCPKDTQKDQK